MGVIPAVFADTSEAYTIAAILTIAAAAIVVVVMLATSRSKKD